LKFVPKAILEHKEVDGMLLRGRVLSDMQSKDPGQRLGAKYWSNLITLYTGDSTPAADPTPDHRDEPVSDAFVDALSRMLAITTLRCHDTIKRSNASCVGKLESVQLLLLQMQRGVSPEVSANMSSFFISVLERCALFSPSARGTE
jgi:hypothetical protein